MKSGEIDYLKNIGAQGSQDAFDKPFSDATRPQKSRRYRYRHGIAAAAAGRALKPGGAQITHEPGHGRFDSEASRHAMKQYGVNEKDMPPSRIFALGREARFSSFRRMVDPTHLCLPAYAVNLQNGGRLKGMVEQIKWGITLLRRALNPDDGAICILQK
jgi:hypothetical protein